MEKIVGFVGYECEDIVLYMAKILNRLGKKIAIVDRTEQEMLMEILEIQSYEGKAERNEDFQGIYITNQGVCCDDYDSVFFLFGYRFFLTNRKVHKQQLLLIFRQGRLEDL